MDFLKCWLGGEVMRRCDPFEALDADVLRLVVDELEEDDAIAFASACRRHAVDVHVGVHDEAALSNR